jgi:hypothetical protein
MYRLIAATVLALVLAGCAGEQALTGTTMVRPGAPPEPMAGRWVLASGPSQCGMTFGGTPEASEGTIAPEGGCPGNFYTSRKWTFEQSSLVVRDHNGAPLGQLTLAGPGRFEGKAVNGVQVTLAR